MPKPTTKRAKVVKKAKGAAESAPEPPSVKQSKVVPAEKSEAAEVTEAVVAAKLVELVEGESYQLRRGMVTFYRNRPVVVTDQRVLDAVEVNSRFKIMSL